MLSETWNTEANNNLCMIPDYNSFHTYRPEGHVYTMSGGISVFCSKSSAAHKNSVLSLCNRNIETCVVDILFNNINITIVAVYRPPQGCKREFTAELDNILNTIGKNSKNVFVVGDMNINLYDTNDLSTLDYVSKLYTKSMLSLINKATRFPNGESI